MPQVILIGNEEQRLVKRLQEGDRSAAREFYALYADSLAGVCSWYIADEEDLKDVFQNALVSIFSHIADFKYRGAGSLKAWATKVVVNESLKFLRTKRQHELLQQDYNVMDEVDDNDLSVSDIPPDVLQQMLSRLPTGYRTVGLSYIRLSTDISTTVDGVTTVTEQRLNYIGLPLNISNDLWESNHFGLYITTGSTIEKSLDTSPWQFSLNGSIGAEYKLTDFFSLYAESGLGYYFKDGSTTPKRKSVK